MRVRSSLVAVLLAATLAGASPAIAAPDGTLTIGVHVTLVSRWLDPGDTEALITPFMVLYAIHDALVKPMPAGISTPSLAESWSVSKDEDLFQRQANELDRKKREGMLHQIQKIVADRVLVAPLYQQAFPWGVGARVEDSTAGLIQGFPYTGPFEDLKVK